MFLSLNNHLATKKLIKIHKFSRFKRKRTTNQIKKTSSKRSRPLLHQISTLRDSHPQSSHLTSFLTIILWMIRLWIRFRITRKWSLSLIQSKIFSFLAPSHLSCSNLQSKPSKTASKIFLKSNSTAKAKTLQTLNNKWPAIRGIPSTKPKRSSTLPSKHCLTS